MVCRASVLVALALVVAVVPAQAAPITFQGSGGALSASASFEMMGDSLIVRLKNTSMSDVGIASDVLTAVFFDVAGNPALTRTSAVLGAGSTVLFGASGPGGVVGGEWAYRNGLNQYGANSGLSSAGFNLFAEGDVFPGGNLQGPVRPNGLQYGITSAGDNPTTGTAEVTGQQALIKNEVVFTLGNWFLGNPTPHISNVTFQYGPQLKGPHFIGTITAVPEPGTLLLFGVAALAAGRRLRRARP